MKLIHGDCVAEMAKMEAESVDAIVCDPPYGLEFMGKEFDKLGPSKAQQRWHQVWAEQALRVLKPGGHLLAFGGTRTYHRLACAIEDAGFEIRDSLDWLYGSGFPKSHDTSKAIDKAAGAERRVIGTRPKSTAKGTNDLMRGNGRKTGTANFATKMGDTSIQYETIDLPFTAPATEAAQQWDGWGTAIKPAHEIVCLAQKPLTPYWQCANMIANLTERIESCRQNVKHVEENSKPIRVGPNVEKGVSV